MPNVPVPDACPRVVLSHESFRMRSPETWLVSALPIGTATPARTDGKVGLSPGPGKVHTTACACVPVASGQEVSLGFGMFSRCRSIKRYVFLNGGKTSS